MPKVSGVLAAVLVAALGLAASCASQQKTPEQQARDERIKQRERDEKSAPGWVNVVRNADEVRGCKSLGLVTGSSIANMQERVARRDGNTLLLGQVENSRQTEGDGEAYECPEPTPTPKP